MTAEELYYGKILAPLVAQVKARQRETLRMQELIRRRERVKNRPPPRGGSVVEFAKWLFGNH